jgi:hypothetical protein
MTPRSTLRVLRRVPAPHSAGPLVAMATAAPQHIERAHEADVEDLAEERESCGPPLLSTIRPNRRRS